MHFIPQTFKSSRLPVTNYFDEVLKNNKERNKYLAISYEERDDDLDDGQWKRIKKFAATPNTFYVYLLLFLSGTS